MTPLSSGAWEGRKRIRLEKPVIKGGIFPRIIVGQLQPTKGECHVTSRRTKNRGNPL